MQEPVELPRKRAVVAKKPAAVKAVTKHASPPPTDTAAQARRQALKGWGGPAAMSATEAVMWRMETLPRSRSTGTSLHFLAGCPDRERFFDTMAAMVAMVPRLRQKVFETGMPGQLPCWADDPDFDLDYHVRRVSLPAPGDREALMVFLPSFANTPCDRSRPPWEVLLIEGLKGGQSVVAVKAHHSLTDGAGLIQLFDALLSRAPDEVLAPGPVLQTRAPSWAGQFGGRLAADIRQASTVMGAVRRHSLALLQGRDRLSSGLGNYLKSLLAVTQGQAGQGSPLLRKRSLASCYDLLELPFAALRQAAKAAGASVNDLYLAGIIGGFQRYHQAFDMEVTALPLAFPVSVRKPGDPVGGNRFSAISYRAPLQITDIGQRIHAIRSFVGRARQEPALDFINQAMPALAALPKPLMASLMSLYASRLDVQASNIPGMREEAYLAGQKVLSHYVLPPRPGCAVMFAMITHVDRAGIAVNIDPAAVLEPALLMQCIEAEFQAIIETYSSGVSA